jgi:hypothetical protein
VAALVAAIATSDDTERAHRADVLAWLASTPDVYRRVRPATPPRHLVSYAVLTDPRDGSVFLVDHRLAGNPALPIALDRREFAGGRWWTRPQLESAAPALFDPAMGRFLAKIRGQPRA